MKYASISILCVLCIGCATTGTNIPDSHEDICNGITDKNSENRKKAILYCKDKHVLFDVAKFDENSSVRSAATKRFLDIKMVIELYKFVKTDDTLSKSQRKKFRAYLKKKFELLKECPGVGYTDVKKRKDAIYKCDSNLLKVFVARNDFNDEVRLFAAGNITDVEMLLGLWPYIKDDKTLSAEMKERFQQRMRSRAKALSKMTSRPSGDSVARNSSSNGKFSSSFDKNGNLIEDHVQNTRGGSDTKDEEPDIASLLQSDAKRVGTKVKAMIKTCYERVLKYNPMTRGKIEVYVYVEGDGSVSETSIVFDEVNSASMNKCILNTVKNDKFMFVKDAGAVSVPVTLTPGL